MAKPKRVTASEIIKRRCEKVLEPTRREMEKIGNWMVDEAEAKRKAALAKPLTIRDVLKVPHLRRAAELMKSQFEERGRLATEFWDYFPFKEATVGSKMKVRMVVPSFDFVLVRRDEAAERSAGGILIPDTGKEKPKRGIVVAVGPGKLDKDGCLVLPPCKAGDVVFVRHWNGADILIDNVKHEIFNAAEVIGVETDDKAMIEKAYGAGKVKGL